MPLSSEYLTLASIQQNLNIIIAKRKLLGFKYFFLALKKILNNEKPFCMSICFSHVNKKYVKTKQLKSIRK